MPAMFSATVDACLEEAHRLGRMVQDCLDSDLPELAAALTTRRGAWLAMASAASEPAALAEAHSTDPT